VTLETKSKIPGLSKSILKWRKVLFFVALVCHSSIGFGQTNKVFEIPFPGDSDEIMLLQAKVSEADWEDGFRSMGVGYLFTSKKDYRKTRFDPNYNSNIQVGGGGLTVDVFSFGDQSGDFSVPQWIKEKYSEVLNDVTDRVRIGGEEADHSLFIGIERLEEISMPGQRPENPVIGSTSGVYRENFFIRIQGYPNIVKVSVEASYYEDGDASGAVAGKLGEMRSQALQLIQSFSFELPSSSSSSSEPSDSATPSPSSDEELPWTTIIGVVTAAAVALALRKALKKKTKPQDSFKPSKSSKKEKKEEEEEEAHYILQLSAEKFELQPDEPQLLEINVYKITPKSQKKYPAEIQIQNSEKALKITPQSGSTPMRCQLTLKDKPSRSSFTFTVRATADGKAYQQDVQIQAGGQMRIIYRTVPDDTKSLRPDIDRLISLYAQVVDEYDKPLDDLTKKIVFTPNSDWLDISDTVWADDAWLGISVGASNPNSVSISSHPPAQVQVQMLVEEEENVNERMEENFAIQLLDCYLESETYNVSLPVRKEPVEVQFKVWIKNAGEEKEWKFDWMYRIGVDIEDEPLTEVMIEEETETQVLVTLRGPIIPLAEGQRQLSKTLVISAAQGEEKPIESHITVTASQVGLYIHRGVNAQNEILLTADKARKERMEIGLFRYNPQTKEIIADENGLSQLQIEMLSEEKAVKNLISVLQPEFKRDADIHVTPYVCYFLTTQEEIPGYGESYDIPYRFSVPAEEQEEPELFVQEVTLKVKTNNVGRKLKTWEEAYAECQYMIKNYVPHSHAQEKLTMLLEARKEFLDTEGLVEFRNQVGAIGAQLILADGAEGYKDVDKWATRIEKTLEWAQWAGDICYTVLVSYYLKGPAAVAAGMLKPEMIDAINFFIYEREKGFQVYVDRQVDKIVPLFTSTLKGRLLSIDNIEKVVGKNQAICWTVYITCQFLIQLYQTKSMIEAAKNTGREIRDELIVQFLSKELRKRQPRVDSEDAPDEDDGKKKKDEKEEVPDDADAPVKKLPPKSRRVQEALDQLESEIRTNRIGGKFLDKRRVLEVMEDPAMVRTIKKHGSDQLKKAFDGPRKKIYDQHDRELKNDLARELRMDPNDLKVDDFRTPGSSGKDLNTDRDYRVLRRVRLENGKEAWVEVSHKVYKAKSERIFGELTDKPPHISDSEWAARKQQMVSDFTAEEACIDYSDQAIDPNTGERIVVESNIKKVKRGESVLKNPDSIAKMYQNKVRNAGDRPEKFAQAQKAIKTLDEVKTGYQQQGYKMKEPNPKIEQAKQIIADQPTDLDMTPERMERVNQQLKDLDYPNGFEDAVKDITNEFKDLNNLPKQEGFFSSFWN
jgi:phage protein U